MIVLVVILTVAFCAAVLAIYLLKKDLKNISRMLEQKYHLHTNTHLVTTTQDKDIIKLISQINETFDKQKHIELEVQKTNLELKQAITNISHDLRTPLTSALGYIQLLQSGKTDQAKKAEYLPIIEKKLKRLSVLLDELFEFTRIVEGTNELVIEKINLTNLVCDMISDFYAEFAGKAIEPKLQIPATPLYVYGDEKALRRVFQNLTQNALKHGTEVFQLSIQPEEGTIMISNKVAVPESLEIDRIFDRFYTSDNSRTEKNTGIGLAIAKELMEQMGGEITAELHDDMVEFAVTLKNEY